MVWLCFKLPFCLFGYTSATFSIYEKTKLGCLSICNTAESEIHICSNKHETGLACSVLSQLVSRSELL